MTLKKSIQLISATLLTAVVLTGCNAIKGLGQDVQNGGEKVSRTAEATQQKM